MLQKNMRRTGSGKIKIGKSLSVGPEINLLEKPWMKQLLNSTNI